jgi:hypothetical protein
VIFDRSWYNRAGVDDKRRARLNIIEHLLSKIPYKDVPHKRVKLPKRHIAPAGRQVAQTFKLIPEKY